jgi:hypothetical protein
LGCVLPFLVISKSEMSCFNGSDHTDIKSKLDLVLKIYLDTVAASRSGSNHRSSTTNIQYAQLPKKYWLREVNRVVDGVQVFNSSV